MVGSGRLSTPLLMLLFLISAVWLVVLAFCVAICRVAARGDAVPVPIIERGSRRVIDDGLVVWEDCPGVVFEDTAPGGKIRMRRLAAHGIPHHGIR
jgi:hypothetical protein